jgi:hypothetical protein
MEKRLKSAAWDIYQRALQVAPLMAYRFRTWLSLHPWLYMPYAKVLYSSWNVAASGTKPRYAKTRVVLQEDTEILIEGAARSANTFSVAAFKSAQSKPVKMAYRLHAAAHVIAAVRQEVPTLVLIRDPEDAVLSFVVKQSSKGFDVGMRDVLKAWIVFYESILPYREGFVLGNFDTIIADFGIVIRRVNELFDTKFNEFNHCEENVQWCLQEIKQGHSPSKERDKRKAMLRNLFHSVDLESMRYRAYEVYRKMTQSEQGNAAEERTCQSVDDSA